MFLLDRSTGADRVLVARRSERVSTYPGKWAGISGSLEAGPPRENAVRELAEETGLGRDDYEIVRQGAPLAVDDPHVDLRWLVHPFLVLKRGSAPIRLDWEHTAFRWVAPGDVATLDTVPGLVAALAAVYP